MKSNFKIFYLLPIILFLVFASIFIRDFRIDASSDSLVAKNDIDYQYFLYYQDLFPTKNRLILAVKSNSKINNSKFIIFSGA